MSKDQKIDAKEEVGNYLQKAILKYVRNENSPVSGQGQFKELSDDYKKIKRKLGKGTRPNLKLFNDMLPSIEHQSTRDGVEIGIFDNNEAQKADNHNKFSAASKSTPVPRRAFIPNKDETFKRDILSGVKNILKKYGANDGND